MGMDAWVGGCVYVHVRKSVFEGVTMSTTTTATPLFSCNVVGAHHAHSLSVNQATKPLKRIFLVQVHLTGVPTLLSIRFAVSETTQTPEEDLLICPPAKLVNPGQ